MQVCWLCRCSPGCLNTYNSCLGCWINQALDLTFPGVWSLAKCNEVTISIKPINGRLTGAGWHCAWTLSILPVKSHQNGAKIGWTVLRWSHRSRSVGRTSPFTCQDPFNYPNRSLSERRSARLNFLSKWESTFHYWCPLTAVHQECHSLVIELT